MQPFEPFEPLALFVPSTEATDFGDAHFSGTKPLKLTDIVRAIEALIASHFVRHQAQVLLDPLNYGHRLSSIVGVTLIDLVVEDDPRGVLRQLERAAKLHRFVQFSLYDGTALGVIEGDDPIGNGLYTMKLLTGLF